MVEKPTGNLKSFHLKLPAETLLRVKQVAEKRNVSYSDWIREAIDKKLGRKVRRG